MFPNDKTARVWFEKVVWPDGPVCPRCHSGDNVALSTHKSMPYRCTRCKRHFSVKVGTILEDSKIGYRKWIIAIYAMMTNTKGISSMKIHRDLDITQPSAWFLMQRIREAMISLARPDEMRGPVEIDEAYIGGLEKNKHADKKGKTGKMAVVGIRDRHTGQVTASPVPETTAARLCAFVERRVHPDAVKYTDENRAYNALDHHETVCHRVGEYVRGQVHTNGIESFWALLRRGHKGTFHQISPQHLHRYIDEFAGRLNNRYRDTIDMMGVLVTNTVGKRLKYVQLVG